MFRHRSQRSTVSWYLPPGRPPAITVTGLSSKEGILKHFSIRCPDNLRGCPPDVAAGGWRFWPPVIPMHPFSRRCRGGEGLFHCLIRLWMPECGGHNLRPERLLCYGQQPQWHSRDHNLRSRPGRVDSWQGSSISIRDGRHPFFLRISNTGRKGQFRQNVR